MNTEQCKKKNHKMSGKFDGKKTKPLWALVGALARPYDNQSQQQYERSE